MNSIITSTIHCIILMQNTSFFLYQVSAKYVVLYQVFANILATLYHVKCKNGYFVSCCCKEIGHINCYYKRILREKCLNNRKMYQVDANGHAFKYIFYPAFVVDDKLFAKPLFNELMR